MKKNLKVEGLFATVIVDFKAISLVIYTFGMKNMLDITR